MTQMKNIINAARRLFLRLWIRTGIKLGWNYMCIESWGRTLSAGPIKCRLFNGCTMTCDLRNHIQRHVYYFGAYEPIESFLFEKALRPGMVVLDVGANVGQYSLIAA